LGQGGNQLRLAQDSLINQDSTKTATQRLMLINGNAELIARDQPILEQDVTELLHRGPPCAHRRESRRWFCLSYRHPTKKLNSQA
jgi:hypothetical protein